MLHRSLSLISVPNTPGSSLTFSRILSLGPMCHRCVRVDLWRSKDNSQESFHSCYLWSLGTKLRSSGLYNSACTSSCLADPGLFPEVRAVSPGRTDGPRPPTSVLLFPRAVSRSSLALRPVCLFRMCQVFVSLLVALSGLWYGLFTHCFFPRINLCLIISVLVVSSAPEHLTCPENSWPGLLTNLGVSTVQFGGGCSLNRNSFK